MSMERAGSTLKKWAQALLPCVWPECEERAPTRQKLPWNNNNGVEREMTVCHQQPHLVPPMRLVVYDDLPSPGGINQPSRASKLVQDGRNLASRTGHRTKRSIGSLSAVRKPRQRPSISAPSNFQHLNQPPKRPVRFRPLVLSIHLPGNQLPELPEFDDFNVHHLLGVTPPPKALASPFERHSDGQSFNIPRKSLPSGSRHHPSLSAGAIASSHRRATLPEPVAYPTDRYKRVQAKPTSGGTNEDQTSDHRTVYEQPSSPSTKQNFDSSSSLLDSTIPEERPSSDGPRDLPTPTPPLTSESTPPRSRRPSQWSIHNQPATTSPGQVNPSPHLRSRTLSGSTLSSAHAGRTSSLSSTGTGATMNAPPSLPAMLDKELEPSVCNGSCPTVYEGKQQQYVQSEGFYGQDRRNVAGDIGVAF